MQSAIQIVHNSISLVFLVSATIVIIRSYIGWKKRKDWQHSDKYMAGVVVLTMYLQMLLGFYLFFSARYLSEGSSLEKPTDLRFWPIEHFFIMLFALLVAQLGLIIAINAKHAADKHRIIFRYFITAIAIVFISLSMILGG